MKEWFKWDADSVDNAKLLLLAPSDRWYFVAICGLKKKGDLDSAAPFLERRIALKLRLTEAEAAETKRRLIEVGLIDDRWQPVSWGEHQPSLDNTAAERKRRQRERERESRPVTRDTRDGHTTDIEIESEGEEESEPVDTVNQDSTLSAAAARGQREIFDVERGSEPPGEAPGAVKRGTRIGDFPLTPARRKVAEQHGVDEIELEHREFCNYWGAKTGREATKLDWDKTWENRCIELGKRARERKQKRRAYEPAARPTPPDFPR